mgnify:CR=1 FL=1
MNKPAHITAGIATGLVTSMYVIDDFSFSSTNIAVTSILMASTFIGSVFPDIDHRGSYIGRKFKITSFIISKTVGHRGATHSPLVLFLLSGLLMFISKTGIINLNLPESLLPYIYLGIGGFFLGSISHLLLDALTPAGIPLFYPFTKKSVNIARIKTGGFGEKIFTLLIWIGIGLMSAHYIGIV